MCQNLPRCCAPTLIGASLAWGVCAQERVTPEKSQGGTKYPEVLEQKLAEVYALHNEPAKFQSILYRNTGHEYLPEMRREMVAWFEKHLEAK